MSGLLGGIAMGAQAGSAIGVQRGGLDPFIFTDKPVDGAITTADMIDQPEGGTARWMFEEAARARGLDPDAVVKGSPEHQAITEDLNVTLRTLHDAPPTRGEASETQAIRGAIRDAVAANGPILSAAQAGALATMPGARVFSAPEAQAALRGAASIARHPAAQAGLAVGVAGTIAAGEMMGSSEATQDKARAAPFAGLDEAGERRDDDTCAPKGTDGAWVVKSQTMGTEARAYQRQIAGTPDLPGKLMVEYQVTSRANRQSVDFDGCAFDRPDRALLEAKYGYEGLFATMDARGGGLAIGVEKSLQGQASRQARVTGGTHPVEWHASEAGATDRLRAEQGAGSLYAPNMTVVHTPAMTGAR